MKIKVNENVLFHNLEDGAVLLNTKTEEYFGLDPVGSAMWNALIETKSTEEAHKQLINKFEVQPQELYQDLETWVKELAENGLLILEK